MDFEELSAINAILIVLWVMGPAYIANSVAVLTGGRYPIDQGKAVMISCKDLDCYSADTFAFSLMRAYGNPRLKKQKNKQPILPENMGGEITGKLDIQSLVGKVIKVKDQPRVMHILKAREVSL